MEANIGIDKMNMVTNYISIQGNIGAGKSFLLNHIKRYIKETGASALNIDVNNPKEHYFLIIDEPVDEWTIKRYTSKKYGEEVNEKDMKSSLGLFYEDMSANGFMFQIEAFTSRFRIIRDQLSKVNCLPSLSKLHIISEGSLRRDKKFFENLYLTGKVKSCEWDIYCNFFDCITKSTLKQENVMIFLPTTPQKCHHRLIKRDRVEEQDLKTDSDCPDYLFDLADRHKEMIAEFTLNKTRKFLRLDFNKDLSDEEAQSLVKEIVNDLTFTS